MKKCSPPRSRGYFSPVTSILRPHSAPDWALILRPRTRPRTWATRFLILRPHLEPGRPASLRPHLLRILTLVLLCLGAAPPLTAADASLDAKKADKSLQALANSVVRDYIVRRKVVVLPFSSEGRSGWDRAIRSLAAEDVKNAFLKAIGYRVPLLRLPGYDRQRLDRLFRGEGLDQLARTLKCDFIVVGKCYYVGRSVKLMARVYALQVKDFVAAASTDATAGRDVARAANDLSFALVDTLKTRLGIGDKVLDYPIRSLGINLTTYGYGTFSGFESISGSSLVQNVDVFGTPISLAFLFGFDYFVFPNFNFKFSIGTSGFRMEDLSYVVEFRYFFSAYSHKPLPYFGFGLSSLSFKLSDDTGSSIIRNISGQNVISIQLGFDLFTLFPDLKRSGLYLELEAAAFFGVDKSGVATSEDEQEATINFDRPEGFQIRASLGWRFL